MTSYKIKECVSLDHARYAYVKATRRQFVKDIALQQRGAINYSDRRPACLDDSNQLVLYYCGHGRYGFAEERGKCN